MRSETVKSLGERAQDAVRSLLRMAPASREVPVELLGVDHDVSAASERRRDTRNREDTEDAHIATLEIEHIIRRSMRGNTGQAVAFILRYVNTGNTRDLEKAIKRLQREIKCVAERLTP